jgi:uncharacterized protein
MNILIAGGTGFIGHALVQHWLNQHELTVLGRDIVKIQQLYPKKVKAIDWDTLKKLGPDALANFQVIINLTGANIGEYRWSEQRKQLILNSRIQSTQLLAQLCAKLKQQSPALFNVSAIGVYGLQDNAETGLPPALDETIKIDYNASPDFLAQVARQWELATQPAKEQGVRVVNTRFGVVLGKAGGVLKKLSLPFHFFIGGKIATGRQPFSWIALDDLIRIFDYLIEHQEISGVINCVAPKAVTQAAFAEAMGKVLQRPCWLTTPAWLIKLVFGQMGEELLLRGQHVIPGRLNELNFPFLYPDIETALNHIEKSP